jgi:hypothetical protein
MGKKTLPTNRLRLVKYFGADEQRSVRDKTL